MKFIAPLGFASARVKRPDVDTADGGKGAGGWEWRVAVVRVKVLDVFAWEVEFVRAS